MECQEILEAALETDEGLVRIPRKYYSHGKHKSIVTEMWDVDMENTAAVNQKGMANKSVSPSSASMNLEDSPMRVRTCLHLFLLLSSLLSTTMIVVPCAFMQCKQ